MPSQDFAGLTIETDDQGYLADSSAWTPDIARAIAEDAQIALGPDHWQVLNFAREDFASNGKSPGLRRISKGSGVATKKLYDLFPKGPGKLVARIAGIPKPKACL